VTKKKQAKTAAKSKVDPTLTRQLEDAPAESSVGAVFTLKTKGDEPFLSSSEARETIEKIVKDATESAQVKPDRLTVFPNVQSFTLYGPPALVRKVVEHSDVAAAIANKQDQDMMIRPVKRERIKTTQKKPRR